MKKNIAMAGLGAWGKNILRNLVEMDVLEAACDPDPDIRKERSSQYPDVKFTSSYEEALGLPAVEAVVIAAPAARHFEMARAALMAHKDVYVEKPLSLAYEEGAELVRLAKEKSRVLMVGHILQYHGAVKALKELVSSGRLGKLRYIYSNRLNIGKLRTEENVLWSFAPHDISVLLGLVGSEPVSVEASGGEFLTPCVGDITLVTLDFPGGVKGHIFTSWLNPFKEQKLVVIGSESMAVFDDVLTEGKLKLYPHKVEWKGGTVPVAIKADAEIVDFEKTEPLKAELEHFCECVENRKKPLTDGQEGLRVLSVLNRAEEGLRSKRLPELKGLSEEKNYFVHETACVDEGVEIGEGSKVWHFTHILNNTQIGKKCVIGQNVSIGPSVVVGDCSKVQNNVSLYKGVTLEEGVFCGPSCVFTNVYNPRALIEKKSEFRPTLVKKGATIGANATVVCGVTIGRYAMIGAGAVIKKNVEDFAIYAGVPARRIGWACRCGETLSVKSNNGVCQACNQSYRERDGRLMMEGE